MLLPSISSPSPKKAPNIAPYFLPVYKPMNNTRITNRLGFTPAIVKLEKKFS